MVFPFLLLLLFVFILLPFNVLAQTKSTVTVGDSLSAANGYSTWLLSPSGDFSFGFQPLDINNNDLFLLSIWYAKIPDKTIVWYANGDKPAPKGSKVQLTSDRGLVLTSPNGAELWKSQVSGIALAALNDTGNLVLQDQKFKAVWETFKDPRDTLLPTQILEKGRKLFSRIFETSFWTGRYQIFLQQDGNLVFYSVNLPSGYANENYFESGTVASKSSNAGRLLVFDPSGDLYVLKNDNERFSLSPSGKTPSDDISTRFYLRATLNFDGVFSLYKYPKNNNNFSSDDQKQIWIPIWSQPENICTSSLVSAGSGVCGYNSICDLNDVQRPICHCPKGYSLIDPNDAFGSCKPDFTQGCEEDRKLHDFEVLINTDWPLSDYVLQRPFTEEECKQSCLEDCLCSVAIFRLGDSCWKKKIPLSNGRVDPNLNNSKAFIKVKKMN